MIYEIARLRIDPAQAQRFEAAVAECADLFRRARGCSGMQLARGVEEPASYELRVAWGDVDDHMVHFRQSAAFQEWRAKAGSFFVEPPTVIHVATIAQFF